MKILRWNHAAAVLALGFLTYAGYRAHSSTASPSRADDLAPLVVDDAFWKTWGDGQAELAGYDLEMPRYGEVRRGTAVTIFVTEPFKREPRVKFEGRSEDSGVFQVMKLNLIRDFSTGIYDYNTMTSVFVALDEVNRRPAGHVTKATYSCQEWCGHAWHQLRFDESEVAETVHSYFEAEAEVARTLPNPRDGMTADALPLWARGLASPRLERGDSAKVALFESMETARLRHMETTWTSATLEWSKETETIETGSGPITCDVLTCVSENERRWTFWVESAAPRRLVRWSYPGGERATLIKSARVAYWTMNAPGFEKELTKLGLTTRPPRTP